MVQPVISPKKLIEVALPLDAINAAAAREKTIRHGHPSNLHRWWARRPLAAARAVIFSQLVCDPEDLWRCQNPNVEPNSQVRGHWTKARARLFKIIEDIVLWENSNNDVVLDRAREEIRKSWRDICELNRQHPAASELFNTHRMPVLHDPFAGGGAIPLEALRLGLHAYASDLNPVAVLINKAMIEIPPKHAMGSVVNPLDSNKKRLTGIVDESGTAFTKDLAYYANLLVKKANQTLGRIYPKVLITKELVEKRPDLKAYEGKSLTVIAWLWARTIASPNPAFSSVHVPLVTSFMLSSKKGKEAYVKINSVRSESRYDFDVVIGAPVDHAAVKKGTKIGGAGSGFNCVLSDTPIPVTHIRKEASNQRLGKRLMAIVAEGKNGRVYLPPIADNADGIVSLRPPNAPSLAFFEKALGFRIGNYGFTNWDQLFTDRQLLTLSELCSLIKEIHAEVINDGLARGLSDDGRSLEEGGVGLTSRADAVAVYLALIVSKLADSTNSLCLWEPVAQCSRQLFGMQIVPMRFDFAEANPLSNSSGSLKTNVDISLKSMAVFPRLTKEQEGSACQQDASVPFPRNAIISTDPPYYDNIGYADLSDFFYIWLRQSLRQFMPNLFSTIAVPKDAELVATPVRHGTKQEAESFFLQGMKRVIASFAERTHPAFPTTFYYAFKQSELTEYGVVSGGWETFLDAITSSGLQIIGTWPMRTEMTRALKSNRNALASSVVLVCQPRPLGSPVCSRREFIRELNTVLPIALDAMTRESEGLASPVAPVDLSQAIIGPGMAIFSRYSSVLEADGVPMTVRTALQLINRFLAEDDFDADTQFCLHWFEGHGWDQGIFGEADVLARAKATSVNGLVEAGVLRSGSGKVQLLRPSEFSAEWNPDKDNRIPIWEVLHQLIRALRDGGETEAGQLLSHFSVQSRAEAARQLSYRLYTLCERKGWADDARAYNELVTSWAAIESNASREPAVKQGELF
jgi:putative DNA methylase